MSVDAWTPSRRLQSAAVADRNRLEREQERVDQRVAQLRDELFALEAVQARLAEQRRVLEFFAADGSGEIIELRPSNRGVGDAHRDSRLAPQSPVQGTQEPNVLRGARIREIAVSLLSQSPRASEAIHYREWYAMLLDAGFAVAGKDPGASFLTQVNRSPVVRRSTRAGVYTLDFEFVTTARRELQQLRAQLRAADDSAVDVTAGQLEEARRLRAHLRGEVDAWERRLQEALQTLDGAQSEPEL